MEEAEAEKKKHMQEKEAKERDELAQQRDALGRKVELLQRQLDQTLHEATLARHSFSEVWDARN